MIEPDDDHDQSAPDTEPVVADSEQSGPVTPPRDDRRAFRRDLMPIWLATAALLAGEPAPDLNRPFTAVYLGAAAELTAPAAAAVHPAATIWVWDPRSRVSEAVHRLGEASGLTNLHVHPSSGSCPAWT